jgi:hypothetical protein
VVEGEPRAVQNFAELVQTPEQPLSFAVHVPPPSPEVMAKMRQEAMVTCDLCGGQGIRPVNRDEALVANARWQDSFDTIEFLKIEAVRRAVGNTPARCNGCQGSGRAVPIGFEMSWEIEHWGTKWDASFSGPFMALGEEGSDVDASVAQEGVLHAPGHSVYTFDTAWAPPIPWVEATAEMHVELRFELRYGEPGMQFAGIVKLEGGIYTDVQELPIEAVLSPEQMWY